MKAVLRFPLHEGYAVLNLPVDAQVVRIAWSQLHDCASLWAIVELGDARVPKGKLPQETNVEYSRRGFTVVATGEPFAEGLEYIGTFETPQALIFHVFEAKPRPQTQDVKT